MTAHRLFVDDLPPPDRRQRWPIVGDEADHALRVKRLRPGEPIELLDGRGSIASGVVVEPPAEGSADAMHTPRRGRTLWVRIDATRHVPAPVPRLIVRSGVPKGDRQGELVDLLTQIGASAWGPLITRHHSGAPLARADRLERIAREACKQCGRAWVLELLPAATLDEILKNPPSEAAHQIVLASARGPAYEPPRPPAETIVLLVGPEGGFTADEQQRAIDAGARPSNFGAHTLRIESASAVGAGIILHEHRRLAADGGVGPHTSPLAEAGP